MRDYEYKDIGGDVLYAGRMGTGANVGIARGNARLSVYIPGADAPAVALGLLKAAGQESVIVPKAYEEVVRNGAEITCGTGPEKAYGAVSQNPNWLYNMAANYVALAQYIEGDAAREAAKKAEAEAAEKKLQDRRDAVAAELSEGRRSYDATSLTAETAIDLIITLQDKLAAK